MGWDGCACEEVGAVCGMSVKEGWNFGGGGGAGCEIVRSGRSGSLGGGCATDGSRCR